MIMCFVVLAFWPLTNGDCSELLDYYYEDIHVKVWFYGSDTAASAKLSVWGWPYYLDYGLGIFAMTIICLLGWVSDLLLWLYN